MPGLDRRVPLGIAELSWDRDDRLRDLANLFLRGRDEFFENQRRDVDGAVRAIVNPPALANVANKSLRVFDHAIGKADRIPQGFGSNDRPVPVEQNDRRRGQLAFLIRNRDRLAAFVEMGDDRIGRPEVDSDCLHRLCRTRLLCHANIVFWKPRRRNKHAGPFL
jgi:hypothetical protein